MRPINHMVETRAVPVLRSLRTVYPFTWAGSLAAFLAVGLSLRGYSYSSSSELLVGLIIICILAALAGAVRMERRRREGAAAELSCPAVTQAGSGLPIAELSADDRTTPMFLRLHLRLRGKLHLGGDAAIRFSAEESGMGDALIELGVPLPLAGVLRVELRTTVRDCFGLCAVEILGDVHRTITVLPPRYPVHREYVVDRLSGNENRRLIRNADEERYHMREYAPGDRVRDINWKASSRLPILMTRVSPESQEKTLVLPVLFLRGIAGRGAMGSRAALGWGESYLGQGETPQTVAERSHRLSWLLYFIAGVLRGEKSVAVHLLILDYPEVAEDGARGYFELSDTNELQEQTGRIVRAATDTSDTHSPQSAFNPADTEGLCVFASAADPAYHTLTRLRSQRETRFFLTRDARAFGGSGAPAVHGPSDAAVVEVPVLPSIDITAVPDRWILRGTARPAVGSGPVESSNCETDYVRARLLQPGRTASLFGRGES